jgi:hypothetical protein
MGSDQTSTSFLELATSTAGATQHDPNYGVVEGAPFNIDESDPALTSFSGLSMPMAQRHVTPSSELRTRATQQTPIYGTVEGAMRGNHAWGAHSDLYNVCDVADIIIFSVPS